MTRTSNTVQLIGFVGKKPIVNNNVDLPYVYFSLGETRQPASIMPSPNPDQLWHDCLATGAALTDQLKDISEGDRLLVQGTLDYDHKEIAGKTRKLAKIIITNFLFLGRNPEAKNITFRELEPTNSVKNTYEVH